MTRRVALVASPGGHIDEAFEIAGRFSERADRFWITARTPQTTALLRDERVVWVPEVKSRQGLRAAGTLGIARAVMRANRPSELVSTGSALTVPYMLAARARGIPVTYVESATRLTEPSMTGRMAERIPGVAVYHQDGQWARPRWRRFGSVFDGYVSHSVEPAPITRVLTTVGSEKFEFPRALAAVRDATTDLETTWQAGNTLTGGLNLVGEIRAWWPGDELAACVENADVVITHAGVGSILMALRRGKCPVVIPRLKAQGEHVDDHQAELAAVLEERGLVIVAGPGEDLRPCIERAATRRVSKRE